MGPHARVLVRGADELDEQRVRRVRPALELGMELAADELADDPAARPSRRAARRATVPESTRPALLELLAVLVGDLVAVAVALADLASCRRLRALREPSASTHGYAPRRIVPPLSWMPRWSGIRSITGCCAPCGSDSTEFAPSRPHTWRANSIDRHLHAEADAEERHVVLARVADRADLAFECRGRRSRRARGSRRSSARSCSGVRRARADLRCRCSRARRCTSLARPPWTSASCSDLYESRRCTYLPTTPIFTAPLRRLLEASRPMRCHATRSGWRDQMFRRSTICSSRPSAWSAERQLVDARHVDRRDHAVDRDVGEERDLALQSLRQRAIDAADQDVRLDADLAHLLHRVLRGLGLQLAGRRDVRHERDVHARPRSAARLDLAAGGWPRGTAATRCRRPCRRSRRSPRRRPSATSRMRALISSVMCGITCTSRRGTRRGAPW